jgi:hypothetical protein
MVQDRSLYLVSKVAGLEQNIPQAKPSDAVEKYSPQAWRAQQKSGWRYGTGTACVFSGTYWRVGVAETPTQKCMLLRNRNGFCGKETVGVI